MKQLSFFLLLAIGLMATALSLNSCQKENLQVANPSNPVSHATDRAPLMYGVTVFKSGVPSQLVTMDVGTGNITNSVPVFVVDANGNPVFLDDLKGVCVYNEQVWATTGPNPVDQYSNLLIKVNPTTGQAGIISHSTIGTVSDIDYDPVNDVVYGLLNNANRLVKIEDFGTNWGIYTVIGNITNLGLNYTAKGLSMVRDNAGDRIVLAATRGLGGNAQVYSEPATGGAAVFLSVINPAANLAGGHCGIGFQMPINSMLINRNNAGGLGINSFAWANPLANNTASAFWGGFGDDFEDLSSALQ